MPKKLISSKDKYLVLKKSNKKLDILKEKFTLVFK